MITGGIPVLGEMNVWGPIALAGGLSVTVGVAIGLVDAKLHRAPKPARADAPAPAERVPAPGLRAA
jgi:hypothetical protein